MSSYNIDVISIFPELFEPFFKKGLLGQAIQKKLIKTHLTNPRDFTTDLHRSIDDRPFGGGDGMVMMAEPMEKTLLSLSREGRPVVYLTPQGKKFGDPSARELAKGPGFILICGRYAGLDERFVSTHVDLELSIGDYVLSGGELAALVVIEAVSRFLPGVLGNESSSQRDSFANGLFEAPLMTRPQVYGSLSVPEVLLSGNHAAIEDWRRKLSILRTYFRRPKFLQNNRELEAALELYKKMPVGERKACGLPSEP